MLSAGASVNVKDSDGATPLLNAIGFNNVSIITAVLSAGANVNMTSHSRIFAVSHGYTPLMVAVGFHFQFTVMTILLSAGASINAADSNGDMPIHYFARSDPDSSGITAGLSVLLEEGARINAMNNAGATPLDLAFSTHNDAGMIALLILNGGLCNITDATELRCPGYAFPIVGFPGAQNNTFIVRSASLTDDGIIARVRVSVP